MISITETDFLIQTEQYFTMPDGIRLYTRITHPKHVEKCPIVFIRTPYEAAHNGAPHSNISQDTQHFLRSGYAVVLQHCRGRGDSEGTCTPYVERDDGLHTLDLIRQLPFYNGEIYLFGGSYLSTVHLCYLDTNPSDIKGAVLNVQTDRMYFRNYRNGCCYNFCNLNWWLGMLRRTFPDQALEGAIRRPYKDLMQRILGQSYSPFTDALLHDQYDDFWKNDPRTHVMDNLQIPVLFVEGWFDFYLEGMFSMWQRLPKATRQRSAFLVGPWGHATAVSKAAEYPLPDGNRLPDDYIVQWFDHLRTGSPFPIAQPGQLTYYSIGSDRWNTARDASESMRLYLNENSTLTPTPCDTDTSRTYRYDPEKKLDCFPYHDIYKAAPPDSVEGVLSFVSQPFEEETRFFGPIRWHMPVSSDCEDTAFFIRVYLVEDGEAYNLTETITSLSHLCSDYQANQRFTIDLKLPPVAFTVKKGCGIRVDIASNGGIYVPHANKKGHWALLEDSCTATNTVYLQDAYLTFPIE